MSVKPPVGNFTTLFNSQTYSSTEQQRIAELTVGQRNNPLWFEIRKIKLTASNFGPIMRQSTASNANILKKILYTDISNIPAVKYGCLNEERAAKLYQQHSEQEGRSLLIKESGLHVCTEPLYGFLAGSPDRIVRDYDVNEDFLVEIKSLFDPNPDSPYTTVKEIARKRKHSFCCYFVGNQLKLRPTHDYMYQINGMLGIMGLKRCELVLNFRDDIEIVIVEFNEKCWSVMKDKLRAFYVHQLLPEITDRKLKMSLLM